MGARLLSSTLVPSESPAPARARLDAAGRLALLAIVAGALALRVWGLRYGIPLPIARPDEEMMVARFVHFDGGDPNPHWFMYPSFFLYVLYGWVKAVLAGAHAAGVLDRAGPIADLARTAPAAVWLAGRSFSVVAGTVTVALVFTLGRAVWDARAGLVAALMLAVAYLHVRESHFFKPDAALGLANTLVLLACVRLAREGSLRAAALAGLWTGIALGVRYSPAPLVPLVVAAAAAGRAGVGRRLAVGGLATAAAVVLGSPYQVLDWHTFAGWMTYTRMIVQYGGEGVGTGFRFHAVHSLREAQGLPFSLFALGALAWNAPVRRLLPVTTFLVVSLLQLGVASLAYTRYLTPLLPPLCVVAGVAVVRLAGRIESPRLRAAATAALLVVLLARPLANTVAFDRIVARPDTRVLARAWLERHVPEGATVLVLGSHWPFTFGDPVLDGYRVRRNPTLDPALGVTWVITHEHPLPFSHLPDEFAALRPALRLEATFSPFAGETAPPTAVFETRDAFYVPLAGFSGVVRGGPLIRIYSVPRAPEPG